MKRHSNPRPVDNRLPSGNIVRTKSRRGIEAKRWLIVPENPTQGQKEEAFRLLMERVVLYVRKVKTLPGGETQATAFVKPADADSILEW